MELQIIWMNEVILSVHHLQDGNIHLKLFVIQIFRSKIQLRNKISDLKIWITNNFMCIIYYFQESKTL